ncbi:hypothetical protein TNCT_207621 [Trichonephila clavata]|uniref:Uncharacterized protein n=1 Tax=Trichonephila clavata TaxID=2740835 RepID=A0A8X6ITB8_TRICU|nr:hypothetical protein TNCT_207621 [Trichonephila clavata]
MRHIGENRFTHEIEKSVKGQRKKAITLLNMSISIVFCSSTVDYPHPIPKAPFSGCLKMAIQKALIEFYGTLQGQVYYINTWAIGSVRWNKVKTKYSMCKKGGALY